MEGIPQATELEVEDGTSQSIQDGGPDETQVGTQLDSGSSAVVEAVPALNSVGGDSGGRVAGFARTARNESARRLVLVSQSQPVIQGTQADSHEERLVRVRQAMRARDPDSDTASIEDQNEEHVPSDNQFRFQRSCGECRR